MGSPTTQRSEFLRDVFITALEGGINYWAAATAYRHNTPSQRATPADTKEFHATVVAADHQHGWGITGIEDHAELRIDAAVITRGITKFCDHTAEVPADHYWRQFVLANRTNGDSGDYDADVPDLIVQFGLFGEVVYG